MSMLRLSAEQLSIIQAGLLPPLPPMALPPQMIPSPAIVAHAGGQAARPVFEGARTSVPLAALLPSYVGLAGAGIGLLLFPGVRDVALAVTCPWLSLTVGLHSLAAGHSPLAQGLGLLFALLHPAAWWLGGLQGLNLK